jgi:hypothetical protein
MVRQTHYEQNQVYKAVKLREHLPLLLDTYMDLG